MCESCGKIFIMQQSIERLPHTEEVIPAVEATCTTFGSTEGKKCRVCNEILEKPKFIDDGHLYYGTTDTTCNECGRLKPIDGLVFELDEETDTYTIVKCEDYRVTTCFSIPMFHEGKVVAKIGDNVFEYKKIYELEIPETIVEIGTEAFRGIQGGETTVKILGKTKIGERAFDHAEIKTIEMPNAICIGKEAFKGCSHLEEIKGITASVIDEMAFEGSQLRFLELCEGVKKIEGGVFGYSSIKSIVIPSSVVSIAGNAFDGYSSGLAAYYKGTEQELEGKPQVKGGLWSSTIYYYSETEPPVNENGEYDGNFWHYGANNSIVVWKK